MPPVELSCPTCHQHIEPGWYFCPNCGTNQHPAPLPTSAGTQLWIYGFSIILPMICYLLITKWPGLTYMRSRDEKAKQIGVIATALLVISSIVSFYYAYVWTQEAIQSSVSQVNADMSI